MLAHAEAGARLGDRGRLGRKLGGGEALEGLKLLAKAAGARQAHEALGETPLKYDRRVAGGVGAERDATFDLPGGDLGAKPERAREARAAGLHHGDGWRGGSKRASDHRLAGEIPVLGVGHHGAADHLVDMDAMQREALDEPAERGRQHVEIGEFGVSRVRAAERDPDPAQHRNPP